MKKKKKLSPKAIRLLRRVKRQILNEPASYNQNYFGIRDLRSPCGTAACIAGWCDIFANRVRDLESWAEKARFGWSVELRANRALGLKAGDTRWLFATPQLGWPEPFKSQWAQTFKLGADAKIRAQRAQIAAERIEHFIRTDAAE